MMIIIRVPCLFLFNQNNTPMIPNEQSLALLLGEPSPEQIKATLSLLIRWYLRRRSTSIARAFVQHIEALLAHPDFNAHPEERCVYGRLALQWRYVISVGSP